MSSHFGRIWFEAGRARFPLSLPRVVEHALDDRVDLVYSLLRIIAFPAAHHRLTKKLAIWCPRGVIISDHLDGETQIQVQNLIKKLMLRTSRFSQVAKMRQGNLECDSETHDMTTGKGTSRRADWRPGLENPDGRTMFSELLSVTSHRFRDGSKKIFSRPGRQSIASQCMVFLLDHHIAPKFLRSKCLCPPQRMRKNKGNT